MLGEGVYAHVLPEILRALHFYMGVGGADRFLSAIPEEKWEEANELAVAHLRQFCKCQGVGCMACSLSLTIENEQDEKKITASDEEDHPS